MRGYFENSGKLVGFVLKRERMMSSVWILIYVLMGIAIPIALDNMFATETDLLIMAETMKNPAMIAMVGPLYGNGNYTLGTIYANEMLLFSILGVAVMNIFLVVRHTRGDEEKGRIEVVRSLPAGRLSNLNATMIVAAIVNIALGFLTGLVMSLLRLESMDFTGSMLFGASLGVSGMFFAAVTALFSQLSSSSRGATGYSFATLGILYLLRAVGDIGNETLSLISPLGLILRVRAYAENYWHPVFLVLLPTLILTAIAFYLNSIRDMDQGFIPAKPGRKNASAMLRSPFGLSFRLLRNTLIGWVVVMYVFGASYGSIMGDIENFLASNELFQQMLPPAAGFSAAELFSTMINAILALCCCIPVLTAVLKLHGEEKELRAEHVLSRVVSRTRYLLGFVILAVVSGFIMLFASAFGLWSAIIAVMEDPIPLSSLLKSMMAYIPALWGMIGITVLIVGILPKATSFCWIYLGFSFFAVYFGRIINLPDWVKKLTPFGHIPQLPIDSINYATLAILMIISIILTIAGFFFYRKRDMQA